MTDLDAPGILHRLARRGLRLQAGEACEMCSAAVATEHAHLVDTEVRSLLCVCRPCFLLFTPQGASAGRFKPVPERVAALADGEITPQVWDRLQIPVSTAFFFENSSLERVVALYPGPAGTTESLLELDAWRDVVAAAPSLASLEPDVEALLVRADARGAVTGYVVPIDRGYELAGRLKTVWEGIEGGPEASRLLDGFFADLAAASAGRR